MAAVDARAGEAGGAAAAVPEGGASGVAASVPDLTDRIYVSTSANEPVGALAASYGAGIEVAEFSYAVMMDEREQHLPRVLEQMRLAHDRCTFHMPFNELAPAAIEPMVREVTRVRYQQAFELAYHELGIRKLVVHSGFDERVYYPEWFVPRSVEFWQEFLADKPDDVVFCYENVLDVDPAVGVGVIEGVGDERLRFCWDVGHSNVVAHCGWRAWLDAWAPYLAHLHIHNNDGSWDTHRPLPEGSLPMRKLLTEVARRCPDATFAIENQDPKPSLAWLAEQGFVRKPCS